MTGAQFLIDEGGWLRAMQKSKGPADWDNLSALRAEITTLREHKITNSVTTSSPMNMPM
jgi:hypothetical protein